MQNKKFTTHQVEVEVKKATAIQALMMAFSKRSEGLDYQSMIEYLADAQSLLLSLETGDEPAKDYDYSDLRVFLDYAYNLIKLVKPLSEIANEA